MCLVCVDTYILLTPSLGSHKDHIQDLEQVPIKASRSLLWRVCSRRVVKHRVRVYLSLTDSTSITVHHDVCKLLREYNLTSTQAWNDSCT